MQMQLPEFVVLVVATIATMAAGLAMLASKYSVARLLFWIAALSFWSMGIVWSATSQGYSIQTQMIVSAIIGAIAAAGLTWVLWEIRGKEAKETTTDQSVQEVAAPMPASRRPTLEATKGSKIDATGAVIPGDLPFQFGRADNNSIIDMPGTIVTKNTNGSFTVVPGAPVNRQFPPPTGEYTALDAKELSGKILTIASQLRELDQKQSDEFNRLYSKYGRQMPPSEEMKTAWRAINERYRPENERFAKLSQSLATEAMARIGTIDGASVPEIAREGAIVVYHGKFAGPNPARDAAAFLDFLAKKIETLNQGN